MAESTTTSALTDFPTVATAFMPRSSSLPPTAFDDALDDVCSICLESFSPGDPATVTTCKHEYHLQCILEWSQRSKECPICWQSLVLMDPASQKLLATIQIARSSRSRQFASARHAFPLSDNDYEIEYEPPYSGGSDFTDHIRQGVAATVSRARHAGRSQRQRPLEPSPSEHLMFPSHASSNRRQVHRSSEERHPSNVSFGYTTPNSHDEPALSPMALCDSAFSRDGPYMPRHFKSQLLLDENQRPRASEFFAFSDSIKSRLSAASARYRDSFSKGTQGFKENFKEKFLMHNSSVKELSRGVQREMSASIAGLAKMMDRLDLKSKREVFNNIQRPSDVLSKGKQVLEDIASIPPNGDHVMESAEGLCPTRPSHPTCSSSHPVSHAKDGN